MVYQAGVESPQGSAQGKGDMMRKAHEVMGSFRRIPPRRLSLVLMGLALTTAACGSSASSSSKSSAASGIPAGPIKLGAIYTLSGPEAAFGEVNLKTETALIERLNAQGGIDGHKITFITENDQGNPSIAVSAAEQLVSDGVAAVVYDGTSVTDQQAAAVLMKNRVPVVDFTPSDTWADGAKWPYAFTDYDILKPQGVEIDRYAKHLGATRLGILTDTTPLGEHLAADVQAAASSVGVKIVGTASYATTATNMTTQIETLKSDGAQGLVLPGETGLGNIYQDLAGISWSPYLFTEFAGYFVGYSSLGSLATKTFSTCQIDVPQGQALPSDLNQVTQYVVQKTGVSQIGLASALLNENDSLLILKYAITRANSLSPEAIVHQIESIKDMGFTVPKWTYTFTAQDHAGWDPAHTYMCLMTPLGPYQTPYVAPGS